MKKEKRKVQLWTLFFIGLLILSGLTAIPVKEEVNWLIQHLPYRDYRITSFLHQVKESLNSTPTIVFYAFDWLAFAHIVIAVNFIGLLINPVKNKWIVSFGFIACAMIIPFAFVMGSYRGIPLWWQLIDCSFCIGGIITLLPIHFAIQKLEKYEQEENQNLLF